MAKAADVLLAPLSPAERDHLRALLAQVAERWQAASG
jgi:hypothetical protein